MSMILNFTYEENEVLFQIFHTFSMIMSRKGDKNL